MERVRPQSKPTKNCKYLLMQPEKGENDDRMEEFDDLRNRR